jgi:hypothetical protein
VALLPHGAAAVKVKPFEDTPRSGRICCGMPTPLRSNSCAFVQGNFSLHSSRKTVMLPEKEEEKPSLDKTWNQMLIDGPIAESLHGLILHCTSLMIYGGLTLEQYYTLFPIRGDRLQALLATAAMKASMGSTVFPAKRGDRIFWVSGPAPSFFRRISLP